jgi:uncharacterized protein YbjT (DUF2867 family)
VSRVFIAGASGRVGSRLMSLMASQGHDMVAASRSTGVDSVTGAGLSAALRGVDVVIDVTNTSSREPDAVLKFFEASTTNLVTAGRDAGVRHHVVLSVVGADRMPDSPYMRAKIAQEQIVADAMVPYTILRATQFFEFVATFGDVFADEGEVRVPQARLQPIAIDEVIAALGHVAPLPPARAMIELGGPEPMWIRDAVQRVLDARGDRRTVKASRAVAYFGASLGEDTLIPASKSMRGIIGLESWLSRNG